MLWIPNEQTRKKYLDVMMQMKDGTVRDTLAEELYYTLFLDEDDFKKTLAGIETVIDRFEELISESDEEEKEYASRVLQYSSKNGLVQEYMEMLSRTSRDIRKYVLKGIFEWGPVEEDILKRISPAVDLLNDICKKIGDVDTRRDFIKETINLYGVCDAFYEEINRIAGIVSPKDKDGKLTKLFEEYFETAKKLSGDSEQLDRYLSTLAGIKKERVGRFLEAAYRAMKMGKLYLPDKLDREGMYYWVINHGYT